jgi:hypothetical protein
MENFEKGGSEVVPTSLGNTLTDVADGVIVECVDNVNEVVGEERALVVRSCETAEMWEKVPMKAGHVSSDVECVEPRALGDSGGAKVGSGHFLNPDGGGPVFIQPIALRTRKRDLPLAVHKGGVCSSGGPVFLQDGSGVLGSKAQVDTLSVGPGCIEGSCLPSNNNNNLSLPLPSTDRCLRGKSKKAAKKPIPYPPGNKFFKYCEVAAGGAKSKKKKAARGVQQLIHCGSEDSDPIESPEMAIQDNQRQQVCDMEGIGLEVVLSSNIPRPENSRVAVVPVSGGCVGGIGRSGLGDILGTEPVLNYAVPIGEALVSKARGDAQHVIDIQEDVGMNFKGVGEEDVVRSMIYEERDRQKKVDLVNGNGYQ